MVSTPVPRRAIPPDVPTRLVVSIAALPPMVPVMIAFPLTFPAAVIVASLTSLIWASLAKSASIKVPSRTSEVVTSAW